MNCYLCNMQARREPPDGARDMNFVSCDACGRYGLEGYLAAASSTSDVFVQPWILSHVSRQALVAGAAAPEWTEETIARALRDPANHPSVPRKLENVLHFLASKSPRAGTMVIVKPHADWALVGANNPDEYRFLLSILKQREWISWAFNQKLADGSMGDWAIIQGEGYEHLDSTDTPPKDSEQVFVAMSYREELQDAYHIGIEAPLRRLGYVPVRVDKEDLGGLPISEAVRARIRRCRFVIADFTDNKRDVYFEAGFAVGIGRPVVLTCHRDHLDQRPVGRDDPDDRHVRESVRHQQFILWSTPEELSGALESRVDAGFGQGPKR